MNILRYSMICLALIAIILMAGYSYAIQDRDSDKDYALARNYGPGWVIPSVLNTSDKFINDSPQKLNDLENRLTNNPTKEDNSDPVLQRKTGSGGSNSIKTDVSNVLIDSTEGSLKRGSGTGWLDENGKAYTQPTDKPYSEVIDGRRIVWAGFGNPDANAAQNVNVINSAIRYFREHNLGDGAVMVRGGTYDMTTNGMYVENGISVYGGYDYNGNRTMGTSVINAPTSVSDGNKLTVVDGFTIGSELGYAGDYGIRVYGGTNTIISNNTFSHITGSAIWVRQSGYLSVKNNKFEETEIAVNIDGGTFQYSNGSYQNSDGHELVFENNIVDSVMAFDMLGHVHAEVRSNTFNGGYMSVGDFSNIDNQATINSENNNYIGWEGFQANNFGHVISNNDYIDGMTKIAGMFSDNIGVNNSAGSPNAFAQYSGPGKYIVTTTQSFSTIFNPSYHPDKILDDYSLNFNKFLDINNNLTQVVSPDNIGSTLPISEFGIKQLNLGNTPPGLNSIYLGKFGDGYLDVFQDKTGMPLKNMVALEDMIATLETKDQKTETEENLLAAARAIEENSQYLDEETIIEFGNVIKLVETAEEMKGLIREGDFQTISKGLEKLVQEHKSIYDNYLKVTEKTYDKIGKLLGLDSEQAAPPEMYKPIYIINTIAKKKIAVDLAIERLKNKDQPALKDNEKEALKVYDDLIRPFKEEYASRLKMAIATFTWDIKSILQDKDNVSVLNEEKNLKALFILDYNKKPSSAKEGAN